MKIEDLLDNIMPRVESGDLRLGDDIIVTENLVLVSNKVEELEEDSVDYENWKEELFDRFAHEVIVGYSPKLKDEPSLMQTVEIGKELRSDIVMFFEGLEDRFYDTIGDENIMDFSDSLIDLINVSIYEDDEVKKINFFNDIKLHDLIYDECADCEDKEVCPIREEFEVCVVLDKSSEGTRG